MRATPTPATTRLCAATCGSQTARLNGRRSAPPQSATGPVQVRNRDVNDPTAGAPVPLGGGPGVVHVSVPRVRCGPATACRAQAEKRTNVPEEPAHFCRERRRSDVGLFGSPWRASRLPSVPSALCGLDPRHALPDDLALIGASPESATCYLSESSASRRCDVSAAHAPATTSAGINASAARTAICGPAAERPQVFPQNAGALRMTLRRLSPKAQRLNPDSAGLGQRASRVWQSALRCARTATTRPRTTAGGSDDADTRATWCRQTRRGSTAGRHQRRRGHIAQERRHMVDAARRLR